MAYITPVVDSQWTMTPPSCSPSAAEETSIEVKIPPGKSTKGFVLPPAVKAYKSANEAMTKLGEDLDEGNRRNISDAVSQLRALKAQRDLSKSSNPCKLLLAGVAALTMTAISSIWIIAQQTE